MVSPNPLPLPGSRDFTLADVGPGWQVWFRQDPLSELPDKGGTVVEVIHTRHTDPETGEVIPATYYRCLATWLPANPWSVIRSTDVDLTRLDGLNTMSAWACFCWLLRPVVTGKSKIARAAHIEPVEDAIRLWRALP
jgi:hypothetical protein